VKRIAIKRNLELKRGRRLKKFIPDIGLICSKKRGQHTLLTQKEAEQLIKRGLGLMQKIRLLGHRWQLWLNRKFMGKLEKWMIRLASYPQVQPKNVRRLHGVLIDLYWAIDSEWQKDRSAEWELDQYSADELSKMSTRADSLLLDKLEELKHMT
jgi:hypothetical protein